METQMIILLTIIGFAAFYGCYCLIKLSFLRTYQLFLIKEIEDLIKHDIAMNHSTPDQHMWRYDMFLDIKDKRYIFNPLRIEPFYLYREKAFLNDCYII